MFALLGSLSVAKIRPEGALRSLNLAISYSSEPVTVKWVCVPYREADSRSLGCRRHPSSAVETTLVVIIYSLSFVVRITLPPSPTKPKTTTKQKKTTTTQTAKARTEVYELISSFHTSS